MEEIFPGGFTLRDEANAIVALAFRNGPIERLHAGEYSAELIENPNLSRITDDEMKEIMLNACEHVEKLLRLKREDDGAYYLKLIEYNRMFCQKWERGEVTKAAEAGAGPTVTHTPTEKKKRAKRTKPMP